MANNIPKEIFIHIPQNPSSLDGLTQKLYIKPTPEVMAHFKATNPHLKNQVEPGQLVILSPPGNQINKSSVEQLTQVATWVDEGQKNLTSSERVALAKHYDLLSNIADFSGVGYGLGMNYFNQHKNHVEQILHEIQQEYIKSYGQHGNLKNAEFLRRRKILFMKLEQSLNRMAGHKAMGLDLDAEHIKRSLGLSTKSIIKQWKNEVGPIRSIDGYGKNFAIAAKYAKALKHAGYVGIVLDVGQSAVKIHEACTIGREGDCARSKFRQGGRLLGSLGGGSLGGWAAYGACNLLFGLESGGTSLLWCGIVATGVGGYFGSKYAGQFAQNKGQALYEYYYR